MRDVAVRLADRMLRRKSFQFRPDQPVRWVSGHLMPVYNDNRQLLSDPVARALVVDGVAEEMRRYRVRPSAIVGTATAGIAPATSLADYLCLPLYYVRPAAKGHGLGQRIEGRAEPFGGEELVLIEDLVSTGQSSVAALMALTAAGAQVRHGFCVFSYGFRGAADAYAGLPVPFEMHPLVDMELLLDRGRRSGLLTTSEIDELRRWLEDPYAWGHRSEDEHGEGREAS
jgi:orotate phosphoribosyltransferase